LKAPRVFHKIHAQHGASYFLNRKRAPIDPDDE
jgi:hypothetical protein